MIVLLGKNGPPSRRHDCSECDKPKGDLVRLPCGEVLCADCAARHRARHHEGRPR